jgi:integrase
VRDTAVNGVKSDRWYEDKGLRRRGRGWTWVLSLYEQDGRRWQPRVSGPDPEDVYQRGLALQVQSGRGELVSRDAGTVGELVEAWCDWMATRKRRELSARTIEAYKQRAAYILDHPISEIPLHRFKVDDIDRLYDDLLSEGRRRRKGRLSVGTVQAIHRVMYQVCKWGRKRGVLVQNVAEDADVPTGDRPTEKDPVEPERVAQILEAARGTNIESLVTLAAFTGMRLGECLGLRWEDVDLDDGVIFVRQQAQAKPRGGVVFAPPKTPKSRRQIAIGPALVAKLRAHRAAQSERRLAAGPKGQGHDLVVDRGDGRPWTPSGASQAFARLADRHGFPEVNFHVGTRHGFATGLGATGTPLEDISQMLGHSSIAITANLYRRTIEPRKREAAVRYEALFTS